jgi:hypothetical protein
MLMKLKPAVNFINILGANFLYQSALTSFFLLTFWLCNFLTQKAQVKCWWNWHLGESAVHDLDQGIHQDRTFEKETRPIRRVDLDDVKRGPVDQFHQRQFTDCSQKLDCFTKEYIFCICKTIYLLGYIDMKMTGYLRVTGEKGGSTW